ncbi:AraC family transcriptional regulator [Methylococcus mesophilus]|uniref:AraC family transcriptional regulator n=1 Tax=Methylococcus mesophilus TaxID=2993564 RepID=UPI00224B9FAF|nr:AraC family transcriptional regulator [Methylococcus mesophilus]UZR27232.1 AraC family transcriptional regulator [Methylococcus mesophilus]
MEEVSGKKVNEMNGTGLVISSDELPEKDRYPMWREMISLKMMGLDCSHADPRPFFYRAKFFSLGCGKLARGMMTTGKYHRTSKLIAADGRDDFAFNINVAGRWEHAQSQRRVVLDGPGVTLVNIGTASEGVVASSVLGEYAEYVSLSIPRQVLLKRFPRADRLLMTPIGDPASLRLLNTYLRSIERDNISDDPDLSRLVGEHVLDILIYMLGRCRDVDGEGLAGGVRAARLAALGHYLEKNYRCQSLSVDEVARALNISRRYFFDLMDETGESFTEMLNRLRLERARRLLEDPKYLNLGIADIAFDSGFSDISYFYRQFRRRFGEAPGAFRAKKSLLSA